MSRSDYIRIKDTMKREAFPWIRGDRAQYRLTSIHVRAGPQLILLSAMAEKRERYANNIWETD